MQEILWNIMNARNNMDLEWQISLFEFIMLWFWYAEKFYVLELGGRCETHHHCITTTLRDSNSTWKSKVDCIDGTEPFVKYMVMVYYYERIQFKMLFYLFAGFCTCTEGYTLMKELQDCVQFSDNGKNIYNNIY